VGLKPWMIFKSLFDFKAVPLHKCVGFGKI